MANINGVEIFAEGTWNGNKITAQTLKDIVAAYDKTNDFLKPVLKLGHNDEQKLIAKDGLPAAGWVSKVYIKGKKLLADFSDIPQKIADLIKKRAYRKVSVEIFSGLKLEGQQFPHLLGAVALLGADTPAVLTLNDIPTDFANGNSKANFTIDGCLLNIDRQRYTFTVNDTGEAAMSEKESGAKASETVGKEDKSLADLVAKQNETIEGLKAQIGEMSAYKKDTEAKIKELEEGREKAEVEKFTLSLEKGDLANPAMKPYIEALAAGKMEFSVGEKKLDAKGAVEELLKLAKETFKISTEEKTVTGEKKEEDSFSAKHKKIEEYMTEHKVNYSTAYKALEG